MNVQMSPPVYIPSPQSFIQKPQQETFKEIFITNKPSQWNMGLCDCCDNMTICLQGLFIPCHLFGKNVERVEGYRYPIH